MNASPEKPKKRTLDSMRTLKDIDISIKKGEFVCVIGDVGSGKSSLLSALIGDLNYFNPNLVNKYGGMNKTLSD